MKYVKDFCLKMAQAKARIGLHCLIGALGFPGKHLMPLPSETGSTETGFKTFALRWLKPRSKPGIDWLICSSSEQADAVLEAVTLNET